MGIEYELSSDVQVVLDSLLSDVSLTEFTPLRERDVILKGLFKIKMNDEQLVKAGVSVAIKKVPDIFRQAGWVSHPYYVIVDKFVWDQVSSTFRKALLHRALMGAHVVAKTDGSISYKIRTPDVTEFAATAQRFGAWTEELTRLRDILSTVREAAATTARTVVTAPVAQNLGRGRRLRDLPQPVVVVAEQVTIPESDEAMPLRPARNRLVRRSQDDQGQIIHAGEEE